MRYRLYRLFRGKKSDDSEWAYGAFMISGDEYRIATSYLKDSEEDLPIMTAAYIVDPHTVGQYIGLLDKNKEEAFEGDIYKIGERLYKIVYDVNQACYCGLRIDANDPHKWGITYDLMKNAEIVGNIYDNPELLEKTE